MRTRSSLINPPNNPKDSKRSTSKTKYKEAFGTKPKASLFNIIQAKYGAYYGTDTPKKKNPDSKVGGPNQKPLTIKPYPMKIQS